jgi:hypothetical protein
MLVEVSGNNASMGTNRRESSVHVLEELRMSMKSFRIQRGLNFPNAGFRNGMLNTDVMKMIEATEGSAFIFVVSV